MTLTIDALEVEIIRGRLQTIVDEAGAVLFRTAFSDFVREAKDAQCSLLWPDGRTIVQASQAVPIFSSTTTLTARRLLDAIPISDWGPGDAIGTNDPWLGTGHLNDLTIAVPIFVGESVVGLASAVAHLTDIGGRLLPVDGLQVFEEGIRIPPMKLGTVVGLDPTLSELLRANVRQPEEVMGDIDAMLNACVVVAAGLAELCEEISVERVQAVAKELEARSEAFIRARIRELPDGRYSASFDTADESDIGFHLQVEVVVDGEEITVDFAGSSPQVPASINCCFPNPRSQVIFALQCLLAPELTFNEGIIRPIHVSAPEASIVNSRFPAAGAARHLVANLIPNLVFNALAEVLPESVIAECAGPTSLAWFSGVNPETQALFTAPIQVQAGFGARASADGLPCTTFPSNTRMLPIEMQESASPLLFEERELLPDSAGEGQFRGGLGQRVGIRCLAESVQVQLTLQRRWPKGLHGGEAGRGIRVLVNEQEIANTSRPMHLRENDVLVIESPGGGGYGNPDKRDPGAVELDLQEGYRSR